MPRYQPQQPQLIDPAGVQASAYARPMATTSDASRAYTAQATGGQPVVDFQGTGNPYVDYQSIDLLRLAEALVALADQMSQYRWRHFVSMQRLLGLKPGTGGSAGVGWLRQVTEHRFFPELWSIRTEF